MSPTRKQSIPRPVLSFLIKATVLFVVWKILYLSFLLPHRVLDEPLTRVIGFSTVVVLNWTAGGHTPTGGPTPTGEHTLTGELLYTGRIIPDTADIDGVIFRGNVVGLYRNNEKTLTVADPCNGLELMVLYLGFLVCFPAPLKRKLIFGAAGCLLICILNIIRCSALVGIYLHHRAYLDFSHHFAFQLIVYLVIFLLWYFFSKTGRQHASIG
jgi:exosortase/archaeosortase family protein